jgi:hypothetical protein
VSLLKNFDKTSRIHMLVFEVRKSAPLRVRWKDAFDQLADEYGLTSVERDAVRTCDLKALAELGVHPFYYNPIIRLTHGEDFDDFQQTTVEIMKRTYGSVADPATYSKTPR